MISRLYFHGQPAIKPPAAGDKPSRGEGRFCPPSGADTVAIRFAGGAAKPDDLEARRRQMAEIVSVVLTGREDEDTEALQYALMSYADWAAQEIRWDLAEECPDADREDLKALVGDTLARRMAEAFGHRTLALLYRLVLADKKLKYQAKLLDKAGVPLNEELSKKTRTVQDDEELQQFISEAVIEQETSAFFRDLGERLGTGPEVVRDILADAGKRAMMASKRPTVTRIPNPLVLEPKQSALAEAMGAHPAQVTNLADLRLAFNHFTYSILRDNLDALSRGSLISGPIDPETRKRILGAPDTQARALLLFWNKLTRPLGHEAFHESLMVMNALLSPTLVDTPIGMTDEELELAFREIQMNQEEYHRQLDAFMADLAERLGTTDEKLSLLLSHLIAVSIQAIVTGDDPGSPNVWPEDGP